MQDAIPLMTHKKHVSELSLNKQLVQLLSCSALVHL